LAFSYPLLVDPNKLTFGPTNSFKISINFFAENNEEIICFSGNYIVNCIIVDTDTFFKKEAIMKKQLIVNQAAAAGEVKADMQGANRAASRKVIHSHKPSDHLHGRVNRHAFGANHEPGLFH